jgi:imidazolonepropionase-like amidohydrolase
VAVGKRADLILLEANPLADVANAAKRAGVMVRGRWVTEGEIQKELSSIRP